MYLLTPKAGELNGYPLYNGIHNENTNTGVKHSRAIIIARDGQSPYMPVTKKQYLKGFLLFNEKKLSVELASIEKNTSVKTDEEKQRKEKWMADTKNRYKTEINRVKELLAKSAEEELQQPVIVDGVDFSRFKGFSTAAEGGRQLVRLNSEYFDGRLPEYVPQFLIVYWRWDKKKSAENFKNQLEANFNFTELKEMIDK